MADKGRSKGDKACRCSRCTRKPNRYDTYATVRRIQDAVDRERRDRRTPRSDEPSGRSGHRVVNESRTAMPHVQRVGPLVPRDSVRSAQTRYSAGELPSNADIRANAAPGAKDEGSTRPGPTSRTDVRGTTSGLRDAGPYRETARGAPAGDADKEEGGSTTEVTHRAIHPSGDSRRGVPAMDTATSDEQTPSSERPRPTPLTVVPLPEWIPPEASAQGYRIIRTDGDGDCFFVSVSIALTTAMRGKPYTPNDLRRTVAVSVLNESDPRANEALDKWCTLLRGAIDTNDEEIMRHTAHAYPLAFCLGGCDGGAGIRERGSVCGDDGIGRARFGSEVRREVCALMMDPTVYWGDQYAVDVIERVFGVRVVVVVPSSWSGSAGGATAKARGAKGRQNVRVEARGEGAERKGSEAKGARLGPRVIPSAWFVGKDDANDRWHIVLILEGSHYSPVVRQRTRSDSFGMPVASIEATSFDPLDLPEWALGRP